MKKEKIQNILTTVIVALLTSTISVYASGYLYKSNEVSFDKSKTNMMSDNVQGAIEELYASANDYSTLRNMIYPVGSIYISVTDDTVAKVKERFGGEWESFGSGRTLVGVDTADSNFNTIAKTGGSNSESYTPAGTNAGTTLTATQIPSHTHSYVKATGVGNHTLTVSEIPSHTHTLGYRTNTTITTGSTGVWVTDPGTVTGWASSGIGSTGGGGAHNHPLSTSTVNTGATGGGGSHTHTFSGTAATISHLQKYITVYMYKRVS